ncbi:GMC family oxidoreductase N-terminal domain-containing protein [Roseibium sp. CAU 1637]|uniref:GMC family oxidoreductase N-terminal domain-containing protein n=1 Tax=Roseibium limicola TaxID=2816037 RepID=A0A939EN01_9HYPH|nr:GMC family oxidoreductase N-terminal domain-containing protein [Roseibium limicola]MBO0343984.1 GMC family oxidoreductase N-terminal domain-containing protein [Roseibium limicola]
MDDASFDYIIVGAGSAGCVLAEGLSASGKFKVLLLEAGGSDAQFWIKVPIGYGVNFKNARINWGYHAQPDPQLNARSVYWPRGRVIGGSSSINAMAYVRGLPQDFDDWENAGAAGWGWTSVKSAYEALETHSELTEHGRRVQRGSGPLWVSDLSDQMNPFSRHFLQAAEEAGWPVLANLNGSAVNGLSYYRSTVRNGLRFSAADAFLRPALKRPNLTVVSNALVEKLVVADGRAIGVRYRVGDKALTARAEGEVIVSAGAINSPQILQLSGLGPVDVLRAAGVKVQEELPQVGKGLQDHLAVSYQFGATEPTLNNIFRSPLQRMMAGVQYALMRRGPLSVPVNQVGGFVRTGEGEGVPNVQIFCNPANYHVNAEGKTILASAPGYILSAQPCRPTSRGEIRIASSSPADAPLIVPNSLATEEDRHAALQATKAVRMLAETKSLRDVTRGRGTPDPITMSDDALMEDFKARASTVFHPTCTCRMGRNAADSVLDSELKVHGVKGLRVVDASAFPNITSGNTNAPTMMLAARAVQHILRSARA